MCLSRLFCLWVSTLVCTNLSVIHFRSDWIDFLQCYESASSQFKVLCERFGCIQKFIRCWFHTQDVFIWTQDIMTKGSDPMTIFFTSGTTGEPKMTEHTFASYGYAAQITGRWAWPATVWIVQGKSLKQDGFVCVCFQILAGFDSGRHSLESVRHWLGQIRLE